MAWATSWTQKDGGEAGGGVFTITNSAMPSTGTTSDTPEFILPDGLGTKLARFVYIHAHVSAVSGTNVDVALLGAPTSGGTFTVLLDAPVSDLLKSGSVYDTAGVVNLRLYPAAAYKLRITTDANESANTCTFNLFVPKVD